MPRVIFKISENPEISDYRERIVVFQSSLFSGRREVKFRDKFRRGDSYETAFMETIGG
jgi:hypothetical protein